MARLQQYYREQVVPRLREQLNIQNPMQVPRITKITVNMGVGEAVAEKKVMDAAPRSRSARASPSAAR